MTDIKVSITGDATGLKSAIAGAKAAVESWSNSVEAQNNHLSRFKDKSSEAYRLGADQLKIYENELSKASELLSRLSSKTDSLKASWSSYSQANSGVTFKNLQEGIDSLHRLDQKLSSARSSANVFTSAIATQGDTLVEHAKKNEQLGASVKSMTGPQFGAVVAHLTGQRGALLSAKESAKAFGQELTAVGNAAGISRYQLTNLSYQLNDIVTMAAMGFNPMNIIVSQGPQIFQIMQSAEGGIKGIATQMKGAVTASRLMGAGIVGAGLIAAAALVDVWLQAKSTREAIDAIGTAAAMAGNARNFANLTSDLKDVMGVATSGRSPLFNLWGEQASLTPGVSSELLTAMSKVEGATKPLLVAVTNLARETKVIFPDDFSDRLKELPALFDNPEKSIERLLEQIKNLNPELAEEARRAAESGTQSQKYAAIIDLLADANHRALSQRALNKEAARDLSAAEQVIVKNQQELLNSGQRLTGVEGLLSAEFSENARSANADADAMRNLAQAVREVPDAMSTLNSKAEQLATRLNTLPAQFEEINRQIGVLRAGGAGAGGFAQSVARLESGNGETSANIFQFQPGTWEEFGAKYGDIFNRAAQEHAFADFTSANKSSLEKSLGRSVSEFEQYLAHQQGASGASALIKNPSARAVDVVPPDHITSNRGNVNQTSAEFSAMWEAKFKSAQSHADRLNAALSSTLEKKKQISDTMQGGNVVQFKDLEIAERAARGRADEVQNARERLDAANTELSKLKEISAGKDKIREASATSLRMEKDLKDKIYERDLALLQLEEARASTPSEKFSVQQKTFSLERSASGGDEAKLARIAAREVAAAKGFESEKARDAQAFEDARYNSALNGATERMALVRSEVQSGQATRQQGSIQEGAMEQQRLQIERTHWQNLMAIWGEGTQQYRQAQMKLVEADSNSARRRFQIQLQYQQSVIQDYRSTFDQAGQSVSQSVIGLITGQMRWRDAVRNILLQIIQAFIQAKVRMVAIWLAGIAAQTASTTAGEATKTAAVAAGVTARSTAEAAGSTASAAGTIAAVLKSIFASAAATFAGIFGFLSPVLGPAAAGPAIAGQATVLAAGAGLASFAVGAWNLPSDMIAKVHKGEMIIPSGTAEAVRGMAAGGRGPAGEVHVNHALNFNVSAMDSQSVRQFFKDHGRTIMRTINESVRSGSHIGLSKLGKA